VWAGVPSCSADGGVAWVLQWCCSWVTIVLQCCYSVVTVLVQCCYSVVIVLLLYCYNVVTVLLQCGNLLQASRMRARVPSRSADGRQRKHRRYTRDSRTVIVTVWLPLPGPLDVS
jgi:hypothetical protein